jgi:DNA polymerase III delta subunit
MSHTVTNEQIQDIYNELLTSSLSPSQKYNFIMTPQIGLSDDQKKSLIEALELQPPNTVGGKSRKSKKSKGKYKNLKKKSKKANKKSKRKPKKSK